MCYPFYTIFASSITQGYIPNDRYWIERKTCDDALKDYLQNEWKMLLVWGKMINLHNMPNGGCL